MRASFIARESAHDETEPSSVKAGKMRRKRYVARITRRAMPASRKSFSSMKYYHHGRAGETPDIIFTLFGFSTDEFDGRRCAWRLRRIRRYRSAGDTNDARPNFAYSSRRVPFSALAAILARGIRRFGAKRQQKMNAADFCRTAAGIADADDGIAIDRRPCRQPGELIPPALVDHWATDDFISGLIISAMLAIEQNIAAHRGRIGLLATALMGNGFRRNRMPFKS